MGESKKESKPTLRDDKDRVLVFYEGGQPFMVRCPKCLKENYALSVARGKCAWCGYKVEEAKDD